MSKLVREFNQIGRVSSASVFNATGKHWDEWVSLLDEAGARHWTHREITEFLKRRHKLRPWWQQGVSIAFEIATGRRIEGQNAKGQYSVTVTKSLQMGVARVWKILTSDEGKGVWLKPLSPVTIKPGNSFETDDGFFGEFRTMKKERRIRMTWQDPAWERSTTVQVTLVPRPKGTSILVFDHGQILDLRVQGRMRKRWKDVIAELFSMQREA